MVALGAHLGKGQVSEEQTDPFSPLHCPPPFFFFFLNPVFVAVADLHGPAA